MNEANNLFYCVHPNILKCFGFSKLINIDPNSNKQTSIIFRMALERHPTNLADDIERRIKQGKPYSIKELLKLIG